MMGQKETGSRGGKGGSRGPPTLCIQVPAQMSSYAQDHP